MLTSSSISVSAIRRVAGFWPWLVLALAIIPAVYRVRDYPSDVDSEFPGVIRPTFNHLPPLAYRLAEPGDRLDQLAVVLAAASIVIAARGLLRSRRGGRGIGLWPAAVALALGIFWYASIPTPAPDGWHGLGWQSIANPSAPRAQRLVLAGVGLGLVRVMGLSSLSAGDRRGKSRLRGCSRADVALLLMALFLIGLRLGEIPRLEPDGYWPRWALVWGLLAWDIALIRVMTRGRLPVPGPHGAGREARRSIGLLGWGTAWACMVAGGFVIGWYHRPLDRFKAVVPQKIYISAMPTYRGLQLAHERHHFKTIINLFPEDGPWRSPHLADELTFAREHGVRYVANPGDALGPDSFIEKALAVAQDPDAWPILVHCHACYDRTPAWVGIYRFVVQRRPVGEIMREIERHRGSRPKASVTVLFNRVLSASAPERYAHDPTGQRLRRYAAGVL